MARPSIKEHHLVESIFEDKSTEASFGWPIFILDRRNSTNRRGYDHRRNEDVCAVKIEEQDDWFRTTKCASCQVKWIARECITYETHTYRMTMNALSIEKAVAASPDVMAMDTVLQPAKLAVEITITATYSPV